MRPSARPLSCHACWQEQVLLRRGRPPPTTAPSTFGACLLHVLMAAWGHTLWVQSGLASAGQGQAGATAGRSRHVQLRLCWPLAPRLLPQAALEAMATGCDFTIRVHPIASQLSMALSGYSEGGQGKEPLPHPVLTLRLRPTESKPLRAGMPLIGGWHLYGIPHAMLRSAVRSAAGWAAGRPTGCPCVICLPAAIPAGVGAFGLKEADASAHDGAKFSPFAALASTPLEGAEEEEEGGQPPQAAYYFGAPRCACCTFCCACCACCTCSCACCACCTRCCTCCACCCARCAGLGVRMHCGSLACARAEHTPRLLCRHRSSRLVAEHDPRLVTRGVAALPTAVVEHCQRGRHDSHPGQPGRQPGRQRHCCRRHAGGTRVLGHRQRVLSCTQPALPAQVTGSLTAVHVKSCTRSHPSPLPCSSSLPPICRRWLPSWRCGRPSCRKCSWGRSSAAGRRAAATAGCGRALAWPSRCTAAGMAGGRAGQGVPEALPSNSAEQLPLSRRRPPLPRQPLPTTTNTRTLNPPPKHTDHRLHGPRRRPACIR